MEEEVIPIPENFYSLSTGALIDRCIDCDRNVLDEDCEYFIEKAVKSYEGFSAQDVIFEYAICLPCAERMRKSISKTSMQSIENHFNEHVDVFKRMEVTQANPSNPSAWMEKCLIKNTHKTDITEFQIYAHCKGRHLKMTHMPYMISGAALDEIADLLSNETLDELDNFMNKHFGPPPELMEGIPSRRLILI